MPSRPLLVVVCGLSFAGKTTLGRAIAQRFGYVQIDVDDTKVRLYGVPFEANDLDQAAWDRIYAETDRQIAACLRAGQSVVDSSRNFRRRERDLARRLAADNAAQPLIVHVDTPESVARERRLANLRMQTRVDWGDSSFDAVTSAMEAPTSDEEPLVFHHTDVITIWIERHRPRLAPGSSSTRNAGA